MMSNDYHKQQNDPELYPMRGQKKLYQELPPCVVFTAEFDYLRRDALFLKEQLQKSGKLLDFHDMPGVGHLYHHDCNLPHSYWFFKDLTLAFDKFVKKSKISTMQFEPYFLAVLSASQSILYVLYDAVIKPFV